MLKLSKKRNREFEFHKIRYQILNFANIVKIKYYYIIELSSRIHDFFYKNRF